MPYRTYLVVQGETPLEPCTFPDGGSCLRTTKYDVHTAYRSVPLMKFHLRAFFWYWQPKNGISTFQLFDSKKPKLLHRAKST